MEKGITGLTNLPKISIIKGGGSHASIQAYRSLLYEIQDIQVNKIQNIILANETLVAAQPYNNSNWIILVGGAVAATNTISVSNPPIGATVTVNNVTYTGVNGVKSNNTEWNVNGLTSVIAADIADSIVNDTRPGTDVFTATSVIGDVIVAATSTGTDGNRIPIAVFAATGGLTLTGNFLEGGLDPQTFNTAFISETYPIIESINPVGLTTKRLLDIEFTGAVFPFTVRSLLSVLHWIDNWAEVRVSSSGSDAFTNGTFTNAIFKGVTPYQTYIWTIVKLGTHYTLTSTANS